MIGANSSADAASAWRAYLLGAAMVLPGFAAWLFSSVFVLPSVVELWNRAGLDGMKPQWLLDSTEGLSANGFIDNGKSILLLAVLFFVIMETAVRGWGSFRRWTILIIAYIVNGLILVEMLMTSTAAVMAARALAKH